MTIEALLFSLAAIGISETAYLIRTRLAHEHPVCPSGESCQLVLGSKYRKIFGVPNDVLGFLFYVAVAIIAAFVVIQVQPLSVSVRILEISVAFGSLFSFFLTFLQWRVIHAWCFWCLLSACTTWLMALILLFSPSLTSL